MYVTDVPVQIDEPAELAIEIVGVTSGDKLTGSALLIAELGEAHVELLTNSQVTMSPLFKLIIVKVELFVPTTDPFTFQVNVGFVPPFVALAVKTF